MAVPAGSDHLRVVHLRLGVRRELHVPLLLLRVLAGVAVRPWPLHDADAVLPLVSTVHHPARGWTRRLRRHLAGVAGVAAWPAGVHHPARPGWSVLLLRVAARRPRMAVAGRRVVLRRRRSWSRRRLLLLRRRRLVLRRAAAAAAALSFTQRLHLALERFVLFLERVDLGVLLLELVPHREHRRARLLLRARDCAVLLMQPLHLVLLRARLLVEPRRFALQVATLLAERRLARGDLVGALALGGAAALLLLEALLHHLELRLELVALALEARALVGGALLRVLPLHPHRLHLLTRRRELTLRDRRLLLFPRVGRHARRADAAAERAAEAAKRAAEGVGAADGRRRPMRKASAESSALIGVPGAPKPARPGGAAPPPFGVGGAEPSAVAPERHSGVPTRAGLDDADWLPPS